MGSVAYKFGTTVKCTCSYATALRFSLRAELDVATYHCALVIDMAIWVIEFKLQLHVYNGSTSLEFVILGSWIHGYLLVYACSLL